MNSVNSKSDEKYHKMGEKLYKKNDRNWVEGGLESNRIYTGKKEPGD